ncbi:Putative lipase atg15 [Rhodosporidiobolus nylandii]
MVRRMSEQSEMRERHAVHLSTADRTRPASRKDYNTAELALLADASFRYPPSHTGLRSRRVQAQRPSSQAAFQAARRASYFAPLRVQQGRLPSPEEWEDEQLARTLEWEEIEVDAPDTRDAATLATLGKMTSNAYSTPDQTGWYDLGDEGWNVTDSFGWKEDGLRGHVFADPMNKTVVVSLKGTSAFIVGGGSGTAKNDKINDNLLFSCCCARVDWSWSTVCDCYDGGYQCREDCVEHAVITKSAYYPVATNLFNNVSAIYPHSQIWLVGHSLGGGLAAMLSRTYGVPSVSFESPGDLLAARRLHLPLPPINNPNSTHPPSHPPPERNIDDEITTHVFHTADPIPMGVCTGAISTCAIAGFALESRCHTGKTILYDTVGRLGWSVDVRTHPIHVVIEQLLKDDWGVKPKGLVKTARSWAGRSAQAWGWWPGKGKKGEGDDDGDDEDDGQNGGRGVPEPVFEDEDCVDCMRWSYT